VAQDLTPAIPGWSYPLNSQPFNNEQALKMHYPESWIIFMPLKPTYLKTSNTTVFTIKWPLYPHHTHQFKIVEYSGKRPRRT